MFGDEDSDFDEDTRLESMDDLGDLGDADQATVLVPPSNPPPGARASTVAGTRPAAAPRAQRPSGPAIQTSAVRPSAPAVRPSQPAVRPSQPAARASQPAMRPSQPAMRPSQPAVRPSQPAGLSTTDIVPEFRNDLTITRTEEGYRVDDPVTGTSQLLNEYEVSLARMLNGQRPVFEVLQGVERLGIPINAASLETFIATLGSYGFLKPPQSLDDALDNALAPTWSARPQWDSSVRTMYQSGLRLFRMGKPDEAASYFEAVLAEDPNNVEAKELLAIVQQQVKAAPAPAPAPVPVAPQMLPIVQAPPVEQPAPYAQPTYAQPQAYQQPAYMPGVPTGAHVVPMPGHPSGALLVVAPPPQPAPRRTNPLIWGLIAVAIAGGIVVGFVVTRGTNRSSTPPDNNATGSERSVATNVVPEDAAVVTPPPVVVDAAVVAVAVDAAPVLPADAAEPIVDATAAVAVAPDAAEPPEQIDPKPDKPEKPEKKRPVVAAAKPIEKVSSPADGEIRALLAAQRKVRKGEKLFEILADPARLKAAKKKVDELATLAKTDAVYADFLADAKAELAQASKPAAVVTAPRAGIATPKVKTGATVSRGQLLVEIK